MPIRLVIADPYVLVHAALRVLLDTHADLEVVDTADSGTNAVRRIQTHEPDVLVLETILSEPSGLEIVRQLAGPDVPTRALVVSRVEQPWLAQEMLDAGAWGYLLKRDAPELVVEAIRGITQDQAGWISPTLAKALVPDGSRIAQTRRRLTPREREVLHLVAGGLHNAEIAERLYISTGTVKNHVHRILQKLELPSRLKLIAWAHRQGLPRLLSSPDETV